MRGPDYRRTGEFSFDAGDGPALAQAWFIRDKIRMTLAGAGDGIGSAFKLVWRLRNF